jgi:Mrp family chromosome partitioning ATPase
MSVTAPKKGGGLSQVKNIILVLSGKGGVGKSTVCCQLAMWLSIQSFLSASSSTTAKDSDSEKKAPLKIGIIDADLCGPSVSRICGAEGIPVMQAPGIGWKPVEVPISQIDNNNNDEKNKNIPKLYVMSMASLVNNPKEAIVWKGPRKDAMIKQFIEGVDWGELDYLFVDTPPGTSDEHLTLCELLNPLNPAGAIVVTTPQSISTDDVKTQNALPWNRRKPLRFRLSSLHDKNEHFCNWRWRETR